MSACGAITKAGAPCKRQAQGGDYCRQHQWRESYQGTFGPPNAGRRIGRLVFGDHNCGPNCVEGPLGIHVQLLTDISGQPLLATGPVNFVPLDVT